MRTAKEQLVAYVEAHNAGVRSGDFAALAELLLPTASLRFTGIAAGPFDSAKAILQAFRAQPPADELVVQSIRTKGDKTVVATYGWANASGKSAGRLGILVQRGLISSIRIEVFS